jgi:hypothetical protein
MKYFLNKTRVDLYKHKRTGQLMTIDKMHGDIATCTLLTPVASKALLHKPLNYVAICNIDNLELVKSKKL